MILVVISSLNLLEPLYWTIFVPCKRKMTFFFHEKDIFAHIYSKWVILYYFNKEKLARYILFLGSSRGLRRAQIDPNLYNQVCRRSHSLYIEQKSFDTMAPADWRMELQQEAYFWEVSCNELKFIGYLRIQ